MPSYIKASVKVSFSATEHQMVKSGDVTLEVAWASMKNKFPLYTGGGLHTPEHEEYSRDVIKKIALNSDDGSELEIFDKALEEGAHAYLENLEHDEDTKGISFDVIYYYPDQETYDKLKAEFEETNAFNRGAENSGKWEYGVENVNFHKPYKS